MQGSSIMSDLSLSSAPSASSAVPLRSPSCEPVPVGLGPRPRILAIKLATLGDLLLALPALRALRRRYPTARLDVLTTSASAPLIADSPLVDHVYTLDLDVGRGLLRPVTLAQSARTLATLRANHYDAALLLHHLTLPGGRRKHRALLAAIGSGLSSGLDNGHGSFLDIRVSDAGFGAHHEAEYALAVARAVGAVSPAPHERGPCLADLGWYDVGSSPLGPLSPRGEGVAETEARRASPLHQWSEEEPARVGTAPMGRQDNPPLIALHPGGGDYSLARRWPAAHYIELAAALHAETGARTVVIAGPGEDALAASIVSDLGAPDWACIASPATPRELAALLSGCALFIGNDAFPMHLAAATGIPVVAIFGPSNACAWGPYAPDAPERVAVVRRDELPCSPCFYRGHELGLREGCPPRMCLTNLPVERVLAAARRLLERQEAAHAAPGG